ncbi:MAG: hypothetical protein J0I95_05820 [Microbacterium sp.]|uniref:hypothetical protein n=1 Tax=unclassified Microbacterium TaxID=2609290 RepID=UPI000868B324|nr:MULTISPECIES: hypothetical protein [unclassified Microbacterium]MBN9211015.1 hypothetical protein [Microbacterium sp.]ODT36912.1 MAG: hypothetical protein ABS60_14580 [Microbacterium sp. SCN 71-17]
MTRAIFHTATTLDGYLATDDDSLDWLFAVPGAREAEAAFAGFLAGVGALAELVYSVGSTVVPET